MYSNTILIGTVGKDIKYYDKNDHRVANLSVATWEHRQGKDGEWYKETTWHSVVVWGKAVDGLKNISKGDLVLVLGRISVRDVKTETNEIRKNFAINGYVRLLRKKDSGGMPAQEARPAHVGDNDPAPDSPSVDPYGDLPF